MALCLLMKVSPLLISTMPLKIVFRLGVIELGFGPDYIMYYNNSVSGGPYSLTQEQMRKWLLWVSQNRKKFNGRFIP